MLYTNRAVSPALSGTWQMDKRRQEKVEFVRGSRELLERIDKIQEKITKGAQRATSLEEEDLRLKHFYLPATHEAVSVIQSGMFYFQGTYCSIEESAARIFPSRGANKK